MKKFFHLIIFVFQFIFYWLIYPLAKLIYGSKRVYIICERGNDARDNGYFLFKYLSTEHQYINQYFIIDKKSVDYEKVSKIGKVCNYKSLKHWFLYCAAEVRITTHLSAFAPGSYIGEWFKHHKQSGVNVFLQHGITHNEFPSTYYNYNGSDLFICGAKTEFDFISKNCGYPSGNVVYTGFARFDSLHNFKTKRQILVMPSWRSYLFGVSSENFLNSTYYKHWSSLLKNKELISYCETANIKIVFYPHYSLQQYVNLFDTLNSNVVSIADFNHFDVQTLLKESDVLITDYSSVFFDFAYMRKPELLYQFDETEFYSKHYMRSYFNHKNDGFGKVVDNEEILVSEILEICDKNFKLESEYKRRIESFFPLYDEQNCERIYQEIVKKFIQKKKKHMSISELNTIVTGDDYGRNYEASEGIRLAFAKGYIQHASIILNKDEKDNLDLVNIDKSKFGLHINLTEGYASYGDTSVYAYSVNDKNSIAKSEFNTKKAFFKLSQNARGIVSKEVTAQVEKYKALGFQNLVADSHGHIHTKLPFAKIIAPILKKEGFTNIRIPSNVFKKNVAKLVYDKKVIHFYKKYFCSTNYFCSCDDFIHIKHYRKFKNKTIEVMTHPFVTNGKLCNRRDISFETLYNKDL